MNPKSPVIHPQTAATMPHEDYIAGLAKGLAVLDCFEANRQRLTASQIAERTGLSRAAARRHLHTLVFLGYVGYDGHFYQPTHKVLKFSSTYLGGAHLPKITQSFLNQLATRTGLGYSVALLDNHESVPVASSLPSGAASERIVPYGIYVGNRMPAHTTSTGKLLLAHLPSAQLDAWLERYPLKKLTPHTITDTATLRAELDIIRRRDWSLSTEEHEWNLIALAVPLYDAGGNVCAALNAIATTPRTSPDYLADNILPLLRDAAREIRPLL